MVGQRKKGVLPGVSPARSPDRAEAWEGAELRQWSPEALAQGVHERAAELVAIALGDSSSLRRYEDYSTGKVTILTPSEPALPIRTAVLAVDAWHSDVAAEIRQIVCDKAKDTLCFCILPRVEAQILPMPSAQKDQPSLSATVIPLYPVDIRALEDGVLTIVELYKYKLFRRFIQDRGDSETQFSPSAYSQFRNTIATSSSVLDPRRIDLEYEAHREAHFIEHPLIDEVVRTLDRGRATLLVGPSSSGKSILAFQAASRLKARGLEIFYSNLSRDSGAPEGLVERIFVETEPSHLGFVVDDIQSNPTHGRYVISLLCGWRRIARRRGPSIVAVSWPEFAKETVKWFEDSKPISVFPQQVRGSLFSSYAGTVSAELRSSIELLYRDDLFLLSASLRHAERTGSLPSPDELAQDIWKARTSGVGNEIASRAALVGSALGRYDIATPGAFLQKEAAVSGEDVERLVGSGLFRRVGVNLSIGHRSLSTLLSDWLGKNGRWNLLAGRQMAASVSEIVLDYLKSSNSAVALDTLRGLHARAGFKEQGELNLRAATVVGLWSAFIAIVERLEEQQAHDPTWGHAPSSAMFAANAFSEIGSDELTEASIAYLRAAWRLNGKIEIDLEKLRTGDDFIQIRERMIAEDAEGSSRWKAGPCAGVNVDLERFHRTWAMGIILCAEASSNSPRYPLSHLAQAVLQEQDPTNGAFYPERVPWCTARVLLGLAACGESIQTNPSIQKTVDWLLRDQNEGGACDGGLWVSGTGAWNTKLEATSMVLLALSEVGFDTDDSRLSAAKSFVASSRPDWLLPGHELDGALSLEAYLEAGGSWDNVASEAQRLSQWARGQAVWQGAVRSSQDLLEQSCTVAQIASHLIRIGWQAVRSDLPAFLEALATPGSFPLPAGPIGPAEDNVELVLSESAFSQSDQSLAALVSLDRISLAEATVIGEYRRYDEVDRNRLKTRVIRIESALVEHNGSRENYLIWAAPGSGKSFLVQQLAKEMGDKVDYFELNFASQSKSDILAACEKIRANTRPSLILFDEVDARPDEPWLYENTFSLLDKNLNGHTAAVFVLIGSKGAGLDSMLEGMIARPKGTDLVDRIPSDRRFEIPRMREGDRIVVMASQAIAAAKKAGKQLEWIEKLSLYYALENSNLRSPRQLGELFGSAALRMKGNDTRLTYDDLFERGDRENQAFYRNHDEAVVLLQEKYIRVLET